MRAAWAASKGAGYNVRINVSSLGDRMLGNALAAESVGPVKKTSAVAGEVAKFVEHALT